MASNPNKVGSTHRKVLIGFHICSISPTFHGETMAIWQGKSKRKPTGGRIRPARLKKRFEIGRDYEFTLIGEPKRKHIRVRGNHLKMRLQRESTANVIDKKNHKVLRAKIIKVVKNTANPHYVRRNIITKGAVIQTDKGNALVTSRPGQDGVINAVLIEG